MLALQAGAAVETAATAAEALPVASNAALQTVASQTGAAQDVDNSAAADAPGQRCNLQVKHDQERAAHDQLASLSPEMLAAAVVILQNGNKHMRQLAARSAHDAEAGTLHPASQVEPLMQLNSCEGWSKKRREPACFGGLASKRRGQQRQTQGPQQPAAALEQFAKAPRKQPAKKRPLLQQLPDCAPKGKENEDGGMAARHNTVAALPSTAQQPLALAAGSNVQQPHVPQTGCLQMPGASGVWTAKATTPALQSVQPATAATAELAIRPAPAQLCLQTTYQPQDMLQPPQDLPLMGWQSSPAAAGLVAQPVGVPPLAVLQYLALLAQQQPQQLPSSGASQP